MTSAWRLVKRRHAGAAFDGEGASAYGGRWNSVGVRMVYTSQSAALAALEVLVGVQKAGLLAAYDLIEARFREALVEVIESRQLPEAWWRHPPSAATQALGDRWVREGRSPVLRVPSAVIRTEHNFLLNPVHPDFGSIEIGVAHPFEFDARLGASHG